MVALLVFIPGNVRTICYELLTWNKDCLIRVNFQVVLKIAYIELMSGRAVKGQGHTASLRTKCFLLMSYGPFV